MILLLSVAALAVIGSGLVTMLAAQLTTPIVLLPGMLRFVLSKNPGIAFSISIPSPWQEILIIGALIAVCIVAFKTKLDRLSGAAFGLIIGGALANLLDRAMDGFVTDYIAVGSFPVFNAADSCITVGAVLLLLHAAISERRKKAVQALNKGN